MSEYNDIIKRIRKAIGQFQAQLPASQQSIFDAVIDQVNRLELDASGRVKTTVKNLSILSSIRAKINAVVLTPEYKQEVANFAKAFNDIASLQHAYFRSLENTFRPKPLLKQIRKQAIVDVVRNLTETGISANVGDRIVEILRNNITTGGSYKDLAAQLRNGILDTETDGYLSKYAKTATITSINDFSAQYTQLISSDLGYEWYKYDNTEIETSRGFCQAMCEGQRYFHVSSIPNLINGLDIEGKPLEYKDNKTGEKKTVRINPATNLPDGFKDGTNAANFLVNRGGWNCGHQCRPVSEKLVPLKTRELVFAQDYYKQWARLNKKARD